MASLASVTDLLVESRPGVVEVTFNRPEKMNAFTSAMYASMKELWESLASDATVRVVVLKGAGGRAFAAGNEISDFLSGDAVEYEDWIRSMLAGLFALPQVTIAAVDGVCVGGGLAVATHCDLRLATPASRFGYPIARTLGNALSTPVLGRCAAVFGESLTREMLLSSRLVSAERAHAAGALMEVTPTLDEAVETLVSSVLALSSATIRTTKQQLAHRAAVLESTPPWEEALLRQVYSGDDFHEGVRAFLAKEKPAFG